MPSRGRIDVHGHLLPGLDDGSTSAAESVEIARRMAQAGYTHLTCSPHIWPPHLYKPAFIVERTRMLQSVFDAEGLPITLIPGGEINLTSFDVLAMKNDEIPTYGMAGKHVLFDWWAGELPIDFWERVDRLRAIGATPVQAHPERIAAFQDHPELLDELAARGVLLQGNLQCFSDKAGARTRTCVEQWLRDGRYFVLGSDVHRLDTLNIRLDGLERAIEIVGDAEVDRLTITNAAVVAGVTLSTTTRSS